MPFNTKLQLDHIEKTIYWKLRVALVYHSKELDQEIFVHSGYITDLFSIPGLLRGLLFRIRKYPEAAVMRDGVCNGKIYNYKNCEAVPLTRKQGDKLIVEILDELGASKIMQRVVYAGVRAGSIAAREKIKPREIKL